MVQQTSSVPNTILALGKAFLFLYMLKHFLIYTYFTKIVLFHNEGTVPPAIKLKEVTPDDLQMGSIEPQVEVQTVEKEVIVEREQLTQEQLDKIDEILKTEEDEAQLEREENKDAIESLKATFQKDLLAVSEQKLELEQSLKELGDLYQSQMEKFENKKPIEEEIDDAESDSSDNTEEDTIMDQLGEQEEDIVNIIHSCEQDNKSEATKTDVTKMEELLEALFDHGNEWIEEHVQEPFNNKSLKDQDPKKVKEILKAYWSLVATTMENEISLVISEQQRQQQKLQQEEAELARREEESLRAMEEERLKLQGKLASPEDLEELTDRILSDIEVKLDFSHSTDGEENPLYSKLAEELESTAEIAKEEFEEDNVAKADETREKIIDEIYALRERRLQKDQEENERLMREKEDEAFIIPCAESPHVERMVQEGIDAIFQRKDLYQCMLEVVENIIMKELGYDEDADDYAEIDGEVYDKILVSLKPLPRKNKRGNSENQNVSSSSSWMYANSVYSEYIDSPFFHKALDTIDKHVEDVAGYNDVIDQIIDYVAGEEEEGGSVGKTIGDFASKTLGSIKIPPEVEEMKTKAGGLL